MLFQVPAMVVPCRNQPLCMDDVLVSTAQNNMREGPPLLNNIHHACHARHDEISARSTDRRTEDIVPVIFVGNWLFCFVGRRASRLGLIDVFKGGWLMTVFGSGCSRSYFFSHTLPIETFPSPLPVSIASSQSSINATTKATQTAPPSSTKQSSKQLSKSSS